jgi:tetratricopeptide (TPR) repeat protein
LSHICENMMHDDWSKYQYYVYHFIKKSLANKNSNKIQNKLLSAYAAALNNIGVINKNHGNIVASQKYYSKSLKIHYQVDNQAAIADNLINIAEIYYYQGNIPLALEYYEKSSKTLTNINDKKGLSIILNSIALIYKSQNDIDKSLDFLEKSLKLMKELGDKEGIAQSYNNIGVIYKLQGKISQALASYNKSLKLREDLGLKREQAISLNNIGVLYDSQDKFDTAILYFNKSLTIHEFLKNKKGISESLMNIGYNIFLKQNNAIKAEPYFLKSLKLSTELGYPNHISLSSKVLSDIYEAQGKGMKALKMHKLYVQMKDSINNEATQKATIRQQTKYEFEKAQIVKENEVKEQTRLETEATGRRDNIQYSLIFLGILVLFGIVLSLGFIKVSPTIAEGIIFFAFLILFEFVLVFTEPYLEQYTNGEPMYNLLVNSMLALVIFPLHAILEKLLKKRIVE